MNHTRNPFIPSGIRALDESIDLQLDNLRRAAVDSAGWDRAENQIQGIRTAMVCIDQPRYAATIFDVAEAITACRAGRYGPGWKSDYNKVPAPGAGGIMTDIRNAPKLGLSHLKAITRYRDAVIKREKLLGRPGDKSNFENLQHWLAMALAHAGLHAEDELAQARLDAGSDLDIDPYS